MRNAETSVGPPTDPFEAMPLPTVKHPVRPASGGLPPGVSPDIGDPVLVNEVTRSGTLPPPAPPVELWPLKGPTLREQFEVRPPPPPPEEMFRPPVAPRLPPSLPEPEPPRRWTLIAVVALILFVTLAYLVPAVAMTGKVLPGTIVAGVDLGGLSPREAADRLRERLGGQADADIPVKVGTRRFTVSPAKAGLKFDVEGTVASVPIGFPSPLDLWRSVVGEQQTRPHVLVDGAKLSKEVNEIAEASDQPAYQGAIRFRGVEPVISPPRDGRSLDQGAAAEIIEKAYLGSGAPVGLPTRVDRPVATEQALKAALPDARRAIEKPLTLINGQRTARLSGAVIAANLKFVPDGKGIVRPVFDARGAVESVRGDLLDQTTAPRDATFGIVNGKPALIPGRSGMGVDTDRLADDVEDSMSRGGSRTIQVSLTTTRPTLDDDEARKLGVKEKIAEYTAKYACCDGRTRNVHVAADLINGRIVRPGETFSLNEAVGRPDEDRGFTEAPTIQSGRLVMDMGGGISLLSTALYNAVFYAGLKDVKHTTHAFYTSDFPAGRDAVVSYPGTDYQWKNNSHFGVLIQASYTGTTVTVALWSTRRYDKVRAVTSEASDFTSFATDTDSDPGCLPMRGRRGFTVTVTRVLYRGGAEVGRDRPETTVYRPEPKLVCIGLGAGTSVRDAVSDTPALLTHVEDHGSRGSDS